MTRRAPSITLALVGALLLAAPAQAQLFRTYVASTGDDANPCTLAAPCRLLPKALAGVASGGEVWMLDSGNYNTAPVAITKSVTILAIPGALGSVVAAGGNAIDIATAGVNVALRNLVIVPLPGAAGTGGIEMTAGASLTIEDCLVANVPGAGIKVSTPAAVSVTNSTVRETGSYGVWLQHGARATITRATVSGNDFAGILVYGLGAGTTTTADIAGSTLSGNNGGVLALSVTASAVLKVSVRGSRVVQNGNTGLSAQSNAGAAVTLSATGNVVTNNVEGISAVNAGGRVLARDNAVTENGVGFRGNTGVFESAGGNTLNNNTIDQFGAVVAVGTI
jgi:hypothetical protein